MTEFLVGTGEALRCTGGGRAEIKGKVNTDVKMFTACLLNSQHFTDVC